MKRMMLILCAALMLLPLILLVGCASSTADEPSDVLTLRVCSWEEYIDEGEWDEDELIELSNGDNILGENSMVEDFEQWYFDTYGKEVSVEYSTFGTNEELYNQLTLGDTFDIVCPSDYMIMKLMAEDMLTPFSQDFFDAAQENNFYSKGVSQYIRDVFESHEINGEPWSRYAAGYMWGTTGIIYNPDIVSKEDASTWQILGNEDYYRQVTIKDNVRDSYFAALGMLKRDLLLSEEFIGDKDYEARLLAEMNDTDADTIAAVEALLKNVKDNVYSFETDSGKADMVTGKVVANYQWSGDAVYAMEQAEEDELYLNYAIPQEGSNLWFDGWVMLKDGISESSEKQQAAEAFVNFLSRPDNVVRNMYYIGYTSVISGGEDETVLDYMDWYYGAGEDEEEVADYDLSYFFGEGAMLTVPLEQTYRELYAQYPTENELKRTTIMNYFDLQTYEKINQMWINVRCYDISDSGAYGLYIVIGILIAAGLILYAVIKLKRRIAGGERQSQKTGY